MCRILFLFLCICAATNAFAFDGRGQLIDQQLDCLERHQDDSAINWSDVCYMGTREDHADLVAEALDEVEEVKSAQELNPKTKDGRDAKKYETFEQVPVYAKQKLDPRRIHTFNLDLQPYYYHYHEVIGVDIGGMMLGYGMNYAYRPEDSSPLNNFLVNSYMLEGMYASGKIDYKSSNGVVKDEENNMYEIRGLLGKDYKLGDATLVTPYFGLAYRYLYNQSNDRQAPDGAWGYDRRSHYYYLPLGFTATIPDGDWTSIFNFEYDVLLRGRQVSDLSSVGPHVGLEYPNANNHQGSGYGMRGSAKFIMKSKSWNFYVEPFVRFWSIKQSDVFDGVITSGGVPVDTISGVEPKNDTLEVGSKIGLQF